MTVAHPISSGLPDSHLIRPPSRVATTQLIVSSLLGLSALLLFSVLRAKFPKLYVARQDRRKNLPVIPKNLFGWVPIIYKIDENDVLEHAGLDAVVFLGFFKMAIHLLVICLIFGVTIISPVRYWYTGSFDGDIDDDNKVYFQENEEPLADESDYLGYLWVYVIFTYLFTSLTAYFLLKQTKKVVKMRQTYLGKQNSITDRTIRLSGIPPELRDEDDLKRHIESLSIGSIESVVICKEWKVLNNLYKERKRVLYQLEFYWSEYLANNKSININPRAGDLFRLDSTRSDIDEDLEGTDNIADAEDAISVSQLTINHETVRPQMKIGFWGLCGAETDAINYYTNQLEVLDQEIMKCRQREYPATPTAFITMDSVATAQMIAQAVLDPHVHYLITRLAPAPHDIIWDNVCLSRRERLLKSYYITILIGCMSVLLVFPVTYLATLLNIKTISKFWPSLGDLLTKNKWAESLVTGLLPTYIFTFLNSVIPFLYVWISSHQGFISHSEEELSSVSKNFFYIFVNLFLVFTMAGTASNYWGFLSDTTKIAYQLASSLKGLSLFYVDYIILQGLGMFPFRLLLIGQLLQFPFFRANCKTARDYKRLYRPPVFNFGLTLPQPMLILIITIIYSVMSTKILMAGLTYFIIGFYVYKYQLLYSCTHPPHSTGKVWPLLFRRIVMGLFIFQLTMVGVLALQKAFILASFLTPLPIFTLLFLWNFQKNYIPLSLFIALRAIDNEDLDYYHDDELYIQNSGDHEARTLDERRELNQTYSYPYLVGPLDGPWITVDGEYVVMIGDQGTVRKRVNFQEWE